jgi:hypothetical protein
LGKQEIIKVLSNERTINEKKFLTPKQIKKALENLGYFYRIDYIWRELNHITKKSKIIECDNKTKIRKKYRLNKGCLNQII